MKQQISTLSLAALIFASLPAFGVSIPYKYTEAAFPGDNFTQLLGINNGGTIAGYNGAMVNKGFTLTLPNSFVPENYPASAQTQVIGINTAKDTDGFYVDAKGATHGFTDIKGTFATVDAPNTAFNQLLGLNNVGEFAGYSSTDATGMTLQRAFVRQTSGMFLYLLAGGTGNSQATGINDAHMVVGFFVDADDAMHGFLMVGGQQTTLDFPGAAATQALGINNAGQVVGQYTDLAGGSHGFVYTNGVFQSIDEPAGKAGTTLVNGINDSGQIVGFFQDAKDNTVGFVATPQASAETAIFRAILLPGNEVPILTNANTGPTDIFAHVIRDGTGQITSGTVDFLVRPNFAANATATGLSISSGAAGQTGTVVINTALTPSNTVAVKAGGDIIKMSAQVKGDDPAALAALRGLFKTPGQYFVNLSTTDSTTGAIRGVLQRAEWTVLMGLMDPNNEVPPANSTATGVGQVIAIGTRDATGKWTSGETYITTTYVNQKDPAVFTGFHIHLGAPGATGPVVIPTPLPATAAPSASGAGIVGPFQTEISLTNAPQLTAFGDLFTNPGATYLNIHNTTNPGGFMRAQLRQTDTITLPLMLDSANEVATPTAKATASSVVMINTLRNEDGSVAAATVWFDVNYRFPGMANITALNIQDGAAGANGAVSIPMVPTNDAAFTSATGFGNYFAWTPPVTNLTALNDLVKNPENHYLNIQTAADPNGALRAQLAPAVTMPAAITMAVSADLDAKATTLAPGELFTILGGNLAKLPASLTSWMGKTFPATLNGATVDIGGKHAPLLYVSPLQINAQVPLDVPIGKQQPIVVNNGAGASEAFAVDIVPAAPAIFFFPEAALFKTSDYSVVTDANPAHAGDILVILATGLGQTTPPLATGVLVPAGTIARTAPVTATLGTATANVIYSIAAAGFAGVYEVAFTVPAGVTGSVPLTLTMGTVSSNMVNITVK